MRTWDEFVEWAMEQADGKGGRAALRRRWTKLRKLAHLVSQEVPENEIRLLLGKPYDDLDPEKNDLKALVAYGIGRGIVKDTASLHTVLDQDTRADPLHFLAQHSGKTFGEKYAPLFAKFWMATNGDDWIKKPSKDLYDVGWKPAELDGREVRIELKASSEQPGFLFQQIRHPRMSGSESDYDILLCVGVSAGTLEWWSIPTNRYDDLAENGSTAEDAVVITRHHGKRRPIWNDKYGFVDEGWFRTNHQSHSLLAEFNCTNSEALRNRVLADFNSVTE